MEFFTKGIEVLYKERVFMSLVGASGSGKSYLIYQMLINGTFCPPFKTLYFYQHHPPLYEKMIRKIPNLELVPCLDFEIINSLPNDGTNYLIIFDDSCDEIAKTKEFEKIATARKHKKINCIYVKHKIFHKSPIGRDAELQNTQIVPFKSPRDVQQIGVLVKQLGLGKQLVDWYNASTRRSYGHLMIDLSPRTPDCLRFCTESTSFFRHLFLTEQ